MVIGVWWKADDGWEVIYGRGQPFYPLTDEQQVLHYDASLRLTLHLIVLTLQVTCEFSLLKIVF